MLNGVILSKFNNMTIIFYLSGILAHLLMIRHYGVKLNLKVSPLYLSLMIIFIILHLPLFIK
jgi:hypothetical protein